MFFQWPIGKICNFVSTGDWWNSRFSLRWTFLRFKKKIFKWSVANMFFRNVNITSNYFLSNNLFFSLQLFWRVLQKKKYSQNFAKSQKNYIANWRTSEIMRKVKSKFHREINLFFFSLSEEPHIFYLITISIHYPTFSEQLHNF